MKTEAAYAADFTASIDGYVATRPRSMQTELGISDIGLCREKARRIIANVEATDSPDTRAAEMGQAVHDWVSAARKWAYPHLELNIPVVARLNGVEIPGSADEIDRLEPSVTDYKTVGTADDLAYIERVGVTQQQQFQRHLYYFGAWQAGLVPEQGICRNIWIPRAGDTTEILVHQEPFSRDVVAAAEEWHLNVDYAARYAEEAPQDKPVVWCKTFCPFYSDCRGERTEGVEITDPELVQAGNLWFEAHQKAQDEESVAQGAREVLKVMRGNDPRWFVTLKDGSTLAWTRVYGARTHWRLVHR